MPSSVQSFSSLFGPLLPPSQSSATGLIAEQPAQSPTATSSQGSDQGPQVSGSDPGSFRDALKRAGKRDKPERSGSQGTHKPEKAAAKPGPRQPQKADHAKQLSHGRKSEVEDVKSSKPSATKSKDNPEESDANPDPEAGDSHAAAAHPQTSHNRSPQTSATPLTPAQRADHRQSTKATATTQGQEKETDVKDGATATKAKVREVNPKQGTGGDDSDSTDGPDDAQAPADASPAAQDSQLAAEIDPGSIAAAGGTGGAAAAGATSGAASAPDPSNDDDASVSAPVASKTDSSKLDLLNDLAAVAADLSDDAAPSEKATAKPAGTEPQGNSPFTDALNAASGKTPSANSTAASAPADPTPDVRFADVNHPKIVSGVSGELLPNGGTMRLRLDPPELGDLQISVHMRDGVMTAAFQTSNDEATRLLSHSLGNLKSMLEAQGVSVDKLHVQQGPKSNAGDSRDSRDASRREPTPEQRQSDRREQQRKEIIQKMWDRLAGKAPVDVVA